MLEIQDISDVHDLHVWAITSGVDVLTAHVVLKDETQSSPSAILSDLKVRLKKSFGIEHTTIQVEHRDGKDNETVSHV